MTSERSRSQGAGTVLTELPSFFFLILIFGVVPIGPISRNKRLYDNDQ